ncbi:MAG: DUF3592 domain-containing protein, partial [Thermoguttaceae bacterium]|nr:DUF3592 domain-containing protein [Thermoguttaceae bacterium]
MNSFTNRWSKLGGAGCLCVFALFWSGMTLGFDVLIAQNAFRQIQALGHSKVMGSVTHSEVETVFDDEGPTYRPKIRYKYLVGGKEYLGDRYRYDRWSSGGDWAHRIVAANPVGSQVEVYHAPADPSDAVLAVGVDGMDLYLAMFVLPFNVVMLGFWFAIGQAVRHRLFPPVAGGAKVLDDGRYVRVRLSLWSPLFSGVAVAGGLAFAGAFVIGFAFGGGPPLLIMLVAWAVILGGGASASLFCRRRLIGGHSDLVIDCFGRAIVLPRTLARQVDLVIPVEKIMAIELESVEKRRAKGCTSRTYVPTVVFTDNDGLQRREGIVEWPFEARAEGLVAWLR